MFYPWNSLFVDEFLGAFEQSGLWQDTCYDGIVRMKCKVIFFNLEKEYIPLDDDEGTCYYNASE